MTEHSLPSPIVEVPESVADLPTSLEELALPSLFLFPTTQHQTSESRRGRDLYIAIKPTPSSWHSF